MNNVKVIYKCPYCHKEFIRNYDLINDQELFKYSELYGVGRVDQKLIDSFPELEKYRNNIVITGDLTTVIYVNCSDCGNSIKLQENIAKDYVVIVNSDCYNKIEYIDEVYDGIFGKTILNIKDRKFLRFSKLNILD